MLSRGHEYQIKEKHPHKIGVCVSGECVQSLRCRKKWSYLYLYSVLSLIDIQSTKLSTAIGAKVTSKCWKNAVTIGKENYAAGVTLRERYSALLQATTGEEKHAAITAVRAMARQGLPGQTKRGGHPGLPAETVELIEKHAIENSKPSPDEECLVSKPKKKLARAVRKSSSYVRSSSHLGCILTKQCTSVSTAQSSRAGVIHRW